MEANQLAVIPPVASASFEMNKRITQGDTGIFAWIICRTPHIQNTYGAQAPHRLANCSSEFSWFMRTCARETFARQRWWPKKACKVDRKLILFSAHISHRLLRRQRQPAKRCVVRRRRRRSCTTHTHTHTHTHYIR